MDMIEQSLRPEDVEEYVEVLLDKVRTDAYPSYDHLKRLQAFA